MMARAETLRWEVLDSGVLDTGDIVVLRRRGAIYDIRFNGVELMSNADPTSELAFGRAVVRGHISGDVPYVPTCVLIGGLGMGFTLRAALDELPTACEVHVCEMAPKVVQWNQGGNRTARWVAAQGSTGAHREGICPVLPGPD